MAIEPKPFSRLKLLGIGNQTFEQIEKAAWGQNREFVSQALASIIANVIETAQIDRRQALTAFAATTDFWISQLVIQPQNHDDQLLGYLYLIKEETLLMIHQPSENLGTIVYAIKETLINQNLLATLP